MHETNKIAVGVMSTQMTAKKKIKRHDDLSVSDMYKKYTQL